MPLLEGTDGVQKMSKSYGNYIGITESPLEMYGKVMSISDDLMWRYYELLTDVTSAGIQEMKDKAAAGTVNPMLYKKQLAVRIIEDFHSADAAARAEADWAKQFQRDEVPENVEHVSVAYADVGAGTGFERLDPNLPTANRGSGFERIAKPHELRPIKLEKLLAKVGLASSSTDGARKIKANAVRIDGEVQM